MGNRSAQQVRERGGYTQVTDACRPDSWTRPRATTRAPKEIDNLTIAAYPEIAHRLPRAECAAASQHAEWEVRDFTFGARVQAGNPWVIGTTVASINYDVYNKANDYLINCQAVNDSVASFPDSPTLIDPGRVRSATAMT